ncbi:hypothetical protein FIU82_05860 [Pseudoalteromonas sp. THAF3]|uniref:Putative porin n=1 Tax=Pseudoalteromonas ruthenica TaxID=151081 RepID=A0A5S3Z0H0_9GAMM|nr:MULTISPECIES: putative porin [Pseudoalteromonas]MCF2862927.1 putative porin [Pseudoalteromonas sp. CNAT2-18]MCG7546061.1 putative porin [Pseudoalteromonas sp. MM17-2]MCG7559079.1 putative porin [Pseudoalteromonas sp. CNAT2-18.1]MCG7566715.1 putative porin [Pseudoalteromonas sp. CnMc7-15]MCG7571148.1 putative porin [Pseudoalteromonas sp. CNC9-20]|tara:strand:+ start:899 stop:1690 length:792 start_codon:yes stop_codon:yes gene_type:complete
MKKLSVAIASVLFSGAAFAQSYQSISNLEYLNVESEDNVAVDSIYYFAPKQVLGPLDQFEYINKESNIFGRISDNDYATGYNVGGEYFADQFLVGASYSVVDPDDFDSADQYTLSLGYLVSDNFLLKAERVDPEHGDETYFFSGRYDHALNSTDYIGFEVRIDDEFDHRELNGKYFKDLKQGNYLTVEAQYINRDDADNYWQLGSNYYFNKMTSVFVNFDDEDFYNFGAKYFIDTNFAVSAGYGSNWDESSYDQWFLKATAQF